MEIYYVMRSLHAVEFLEKEVAKGLIDYMVKRGYDSDDMLTMSSKKGGYRRAVHLIWLVSESVPNLKNKHFLMHIQIFAQNCYKEMPPLQQMRLFNALKKLTHFKNEKLMNNLRKATFGKHLSDNSKDGTAQEDEFVKEF